MRIVRTPSTAILDREVVLKSLGLGADGVMICEVEESHEEELAEKLVDDVRGELEKMGVEPERIFLKPMVLPIFKVMPQFITEFTNAITKLGKIPEEKREKLLG
jgi:coenzyme F420-reducing hydrogenase delta subunit